MDEPGERDSGERTVVERDLEAAEVIEAASVQNAVAAGGPLVLLAVPLSHLLAALQTRLRRLTRRNR